MCRMMNLKVLPRVLALPNVSLNAAAYRIQMDSGRDVS